MKNNPFPHWFRAYTPIYKAVFWLFGLAVLAVLTLMYSRILLLLLLIIGFVLVFVLLRKEVEPVPKIEKPFVSVKELFEEYFALSDVIKNGKNFNRRLTACRRSNELLPYFVKYWLAENDELPPTIMCRDVGIKLLMRGAQWDCAESAIKKCAELGLYDDNGQAALNYFNRYKKAAFAVINFLLVNPGFKQKNIYKALPEVDQDCLKEIMRSSVIVKKIRAGDTYLIYINSDALRY